MKKASWVLLSVVLIFLCVLIGIVIGRKTTSDSIVISYEKTLDITQTPTEETVSAIGKDGKININTASISQLMLLPDIGEVLAKRIVAYRRQNGDFLSVDDLVLVDGIGQSRLEDLRDYITVGG